MIRIYTDTQTMSHPIGYKGQMSIDQGFFFAPYLPGRDDHERIEHRPITEFQMRIMKSIKTTPMIRMSRS